MFYTIRGCLEKFWDEGIVPCFDPIGCPTLGVDFRLEKEGI